MIKIGVIGYGYWGPNIVRNFMATPGAKVTALCDADKGAFKRAAQVYPSMRLTKDYRDITGSTDIDAVAIVTPVKTHYEIAMRALKNGKHVFIEKPLTASSSQARELIRVADKKGLVIMVDHTFLFTGAVGKIKELVNKNVLGKIYYYDSMRVNLGLFQHDVNVIWDLAPHDLSIMDHIIKDKPEAISATGMDHFNRGLEDVAYLTVYFRDTKIAHFNINWLSPVKIRTTCIGGSKKMLVWNDLDADEKIKIYDRGVEMKNRQGVYKLLIEYRAGDLWAPMIGQSEALRSETEYFVSCVNKGKKPFNDGESGFRIVRILEAARASLKNNGKTIKIKD